MQDNKKYLSVSEILSRALHLTKNNFVEVLKVIGIFILPTILVVLALIIQLSMPTLLSFDSFYHSRVDIAYVFGIFISVIISTLLVSLIVTFTNGVIIKVLDDFNTGNYLGVKESIKYVWKKKWSVIGLNILCLAMLIVLMIAILFSILIVTFLRLEVILFMVLPIIILISIAIPSIFLMFNVSLIVKDLSVDEAIFEIFRLFKKGFFWNTVGKVAVITAINVVVGSILGFIGVVPILGQIVMIIGNIIMQIYLLSYLSVFIRDRLNEVEILES